MKGSYVHIFDNEKHLPSPVFKQIGWESKVYIYMA